VKNSQLRLVLHRYASVLVVSALLIGCGGGTDAPGAGRSGARGPAGPVKVQLRTVDSVQWVDQIEALGTTQANESLTITAKVTETVRKISFSDGERVEAGVVLVELTGAGEVAALKEAQSAYSEAQKQYTRFEGLVAQGTVTRAQLDTQTAMRDQARARMDAIRARLSDRVITAPFAGVLGFRQVSQGTLVTPGTAITTLDDVSILKLDFSIPEIFLGSIGVDAKVVARSSAYPDEAFVGTVRSIGSRVDPLTRAVTVRAHIDNDKASGRLKPGMLLTVRLATPGRQTLAVDEIAVIQTGSLAFVYRVDNAGIAQRVDVQIGARQAGRVEITAGLEAGDQVVAEGVVKMRPGTPVTQ
jgi:membrane fusion protein (multidrug efflux system)